MLWSPPSVRSLGFLSREGEVEAREPRVRKASDNCWMASALSKGVMGMSPQSRIRAHDVYGLRPARGLKPRKEVWRALAARMARGPKRAPGEGC